MTTDYIIVFKRYHKVLIVKIGLIDMHLNAEPVKTVKLQKLQRVKIPKELINDLKWKEGDTLMILVDRTKRAVIVAKLDDYESLRG